MGSFEIKDQFYLNGQAFKIISGSIHYFRVVPEYWRDRLEKLKAMGCNTVETYVPWNMHEPHKGKYCFDGMLDLKCFIELAQQLGLWVIVRPSPYICAEWEFGGLPAWLLAEDGMHLRGSYAPFLKHVKSYYHQLFKILSPLQITEGGPIILFQLENEYGYYGSDTYYLQTLKEMMVELGAKIPFVTSDGPWNNCLGIGSVEGVLPTGNFGSKAEEQFEVLSQYTQGGPLMCMEFWVGWFDHWGNGGHKTSELKQNVKDLEYILNHGSVNIYMFEGGTNFGFMNGANDYDELTPDVTSYDYDAVLTENGELTPKYEAFKQVISTVTAVPEVEFSTHIRKIEYGRLKLEQKVSLFNILDDLSEAVESVYPMCMEKLGQNYGYTLYRTELVKEGSINTIRFYETNDRVLSYVNEELKGTFYDRQLLEEQNLSVTNTEGATLDLLTENMGRVNFGVKLEKQRKGIDGAVLVNGHQLFNWKQYPLPLDNIEKIDFSKGYKHGTPAFYRFSFKAEEQGDTFLDFSGWGKGCAFINGFNLGRFWEIGPQKRLYIPAPLIKLGINTIILFETEGKASDYITLCNKNEFK